MRANELEQIESSIKHAKRTVDLGSALERLFDNRDFKQVITEGYFNQEAVRLVHLKSDPNMQSPDTQKAIISQMDSIGYLNQYFSTVLALASMASKSIDADEQTREDLLAEGL